MTFDTPSVDLPAARLTAMLMDARARTLALARDLDGEKLMGPRLPIVNPPLWELGHMGWFQERWCLRPKADGSLGPSLLENADALYDSATVAHDTRWDLRLPSLAATLSYLEEVLERLMDRINRGDGHPRLNYFAEHATYHEDMHGEALWQTRQTLSYPAPSVGEPPRAPWGFLAGDAAIPGGLFLLGARHEAGFVFDNEKWAHEVVLEPFAISRTPVTNGQFMRFVEDAGYRRPELWSEAGWQWRLDAQAEAPVYWKRREGGWNMRRFDEQLPLPEHLPAMHVNWFEADAWCRWAGRRLPTEAEWERAASGGLDYRYPWGNAPPEPGRANLDGQHSGPTSVSAFAAGDSEAACRQMLGNVWEWTADWFHPYPGFVADPYAEYSEPWFGDHKVLRGGSFATRSRLIRNTWRNFYTPDRRDAFAGFRTCAR